MNNKALKALLDYQQADEDGVMVLTSRQAIHEVAARLNEAERQLWALLANTDTAQDLAKAKDDARKFLEGEANNSPTGSDAADRLHQRWLADNKVDSEEWYRIAGIRPEDFEEFILCSKCQEAVGLKSKQNPSHPAKLAQFTKQDPTFNSGTAKDTPNHE